MITIDYNEILREVEVMEAAPGIIGQEMRTAMQVSVDVAEQYVAAETPVNTGALRGSIATNIRGTPLNLAGEVFTPSLYGWPVERGRRPGKRPPVEAIKLWVVRKGIATGAEADSVAFLIARAIGRRGTQGAAMFHKGFRQAEPVIIRIWRDAVGRMAVRLESKS